MLASLSNFGINLNASNYELHPCPKDSPDLLQGNYCSAIRFSDTLSTQILDFVSNNQCHEGMQIGTVEFLSDARGQISFDAINQSLSNCVLSVTKEANLNTEIYETEYDRPPSNAMFLRRKGFVHSKLLIKPGTKSSDASLRVRNPVTAKRATTTFKAVKGGRNLKRNGYKRRYDTLNKHSNGGLPNKRKKCANNNSVTLTQAIGEILFVEQTSFNKIKNVIQSRTNINVSKANMAQFQTVLDRMATFYEKNNLYYLKPEYHKSVNWRESTVLTQSEKNKILNRNVKAKTKKCAPNLERKEKECIAVSSEQRKSESEYERITSEIMYNRYDALYQKKFEQRTTYMKSITDNSVYFKKMRALIKSESDSERKQKMKQEFRMIFDSRKQGIKDMKSVAEKLKVELCVIKKRINVYVKEQQQLQLQNNLRKVT